MVHRPFLRNALSWILRSTSKQIQSVYATAWTQLIHESMYNYASSWPSLLCGLAVCPRCFALRCPSSSGDFTHPRKWRGLKITKIYITCPMTRVLTTTTYRFIFSQLLPVSTWRASKSLSDGTRGNGFLPSQLRKGKREPNFNRSKLSRGLLSVDCSPVVREFRKNRGTRDRARRSPPESGKEQNPSWSFRASNLTPYQLIRKPSCWTCLDLLVYGNLPFEQNHAGTYTDWHRILTWRTGLTYVKRTKGNFSLWQ